MTDDEKWLFTALCKVVIYHYCDVRYKHEAESAAGRLAQVGVLRDVEDAEAAYTRYEEMVVAYALEHLPPGYATRHDYWGAKCVTNDHEWRAPKTHTLYAGDAPGRIMFFDDFAALADYAADHVEGVTP